MRIPPNGWNPAGHAAALLLAALAACATASTAPPAVPVAATADRSSESLATRVIALIVSETGSPQERVIPAARFAENLGLDEVDMIALVMALEEEFGMEVADEDFAGLRTVADAIEYVRTHT